MSKFGRARVLAVTIVGVALVLGGLWLMAQSGDKNGKQFVAIFDDVTGLVNHSSVLHRGVRVGEITEIQGEGDGWRQASLTVNLDADSDMKLTSDASVTLRLKSVLGEMFLDLDPGHSSQPLDGPITRTHRDTSFDRLIYSGAEAVKDIQGAQETKEVVDRLKRLVQTSGTDVVAIATDARTLLDTLNSKVDTINTIISNLDQITASQDGNEGKLGDQLVQINSVIASARRTLANHHDQLVDLTKTLQRLLDATDLSKLDEQLSKLPEYFDKIYSGIRTANALVRHCIPSAAYLIPFPIDAAQQAYQDAYEWSKNPVTQALWLNILNAYLGAGQPGCAS